LVLMVVAWTALFHAIISNDAVHKDYIYTPAWVDFLVERVTDDATYEAIIAGALE